MYFDIKLNPSIHQSFKQWVNIKIVTIIHYTHTWQSMSSSAITGIYIYSWPSFMLQLLYPNPYMNVRSIYVILSYHSDRRRKKSSTELHSNKASTGMFLAIYGYIKKKKHREKRKNYIFTQTFIHIYIFLPSQKPQQFISLEKHNL